MPIGLEIAAVLLHAASLILLIYWSIGLGRLIMTMRRHPTARAGTNLPLPPVPPEVCVVIPAHNEEAGITHLIASLRAQDYPAFRVVLCLDRCTDRTEAVARDAIAGDDRFELFINMECPPGWAGKVNAIWQGLHHAAAPAARHSPILVFADADTTFDPKCLSATVALMHARSLDLLSLLSTLTHDRWFELLAQPAATIETVTQYPILSASRSERRRAFANGQFMMFRRGAYEAVGGHASVHDELLEDVALARRIADAKRPAAVFIADDMLRCRMYASWSEFSRGWRRIYIELARRNPRRLVRAAIRVIQFGTVYPIAALTNCIGGVALLAMAESRAWPHAAAWGLAAALVGTAAVIPILLTVGASYRIGRAPLWALPAFPIGAALVAWMMFRASRDLRAGRAIEWGGRQYVRALPSTQTDAQS